MMVFFVSEANFTVTGAGYGGLQCQSDSLTILPPNVQIVRIPTDTIPTNVWQFDAGCISIFPNDTLLVLDISLNFTAIWMANEYKYISVSIYGFSLSCEEPSMLVFYDGFLAGCSGQRCRHYLQCIPSGGSLTNEGHMMCTFNCHINPQEATVIVRLQRMRYADLSYSQWQLCGINATLIV